MHRTGTKGLIAAASAMLAVAGGTLAFTATTASATSNLSVTLSAQGAGASATWDPAGNPVLIQGSQNSTAQVQINNPPAAPPADAPTFGTHTAANESPHWLLQFTGGDALLDVIGDPTSWTVIRGAAPCNAIPPNRFDTYAAQLAFIQNEGCGGSVTSAVIATTGGIDGQPPNSASEIFGIVYDGMALPAGPDTVTVKDPGAQASTLGAAITPLHMQASSDKGDAIASWLAGGLPPGLSINPANGTISGTPTAAGTFSVMVDAIDNGDTAGSVTFNWSVSPRVTYSGTVRLFRLGLCLDDRVNSTSNGAIVQVWRCNGLPNQDWQVMNDGTIRHRGLCLDARDFGIQNGTPVQLWHCTGRQNQKWDTRGFRVHYDNPVAFNKVLDDTASGGNGTRQEIFDNNGTANQLWATF